MTKHILCALAVLCGAAPMAWGAPVVLASAQMDAITAGADTSGTAAAVATGPIAFTGTAANAVALQTTMNGQPSLAGYAAGSEAVATATSVGPGGNSGTAASTSANVPGTGATYVITQNMQVLGTSISGSTTMAFGAFAGPQLF
ncbi:MAG: hypothetical protein M0037_00160 [Betaproteobacteria bacterium]|nr:hypothetical protein [Betaproteobacteria bacterium]